MPSPTNRARVRDLVAQILVAAMPEVAGRVFRARAWAVQQDQLPAVLVYGYDETKTRTNMDAAVAQYDVSCVMAVRLMAADRGRDAAAVEAELEALAGAACRAVLTSRALLQPPAPGAAAGPVIRVAGVRTTLGVRADGELATGEGLIAFEMAWQEQYRLPDPDLDCEEPFLALSILPDPSVP